MKKTLIIPLSYCLCIICLSIPACVTVEKAEVNVDEKKLIIELTKPENMEKIAHALKLVGEKKQLAEVKPKAEEGDAEAQNMLGDMHYYGKGVEQNYEEAAKWYFKAAEQGNAIAQNMIGLIHSKGEGVAQEYKEAVRWYLKSAEQNQPDAQHNLGAMYENGLGVEKDLKKAIQWYRKAAKQGKEEAKAALKKLTDQQKPNKPKKNK